MNLKPKPETACGADYEHERHLYEVKPKKKMRPAAKKVCDGIFRHHKERQ